jgi:hypothetical protein
VLPIWEAYQSALDRPLHPPMSGRHLPATPSTEGSPTPPTYALPTYSFPTAGGVSGGSGGAGTPFLTPGAPCSAREGVSARQGGEPRRAVAAPRARHPGC